MPFAGWSQRHLKVIKSYPGNGGRQIMCLWVGEIAVRTDGDRPHLCVSRPDVSVSPGRTSPCLSANVSVSLVPASRRRWWMVGDAVSENGR